MTNFNDFGQKPTDSINLSKIGDKTFTILEVVKSDYTASDGTISEGVKITTEEDWTKEDGTTVNKIHTTRRAIVSKLSDDEFLKALDMGEHFKVKCPTEKVKPQGSGQPYFNLVAAE